MKKISNKEKPTQDRTNQELDRRSFISKTGNLLVTTCAIGTLAGWTRLATPNFHSDRPKTFPLGKKSLFKIDTVTWLRKHDLFVVRDKNGMGAFSSRCTHLGCTVKRTAEGFVCPCHGAKYDKNGLIICGPATRPLPWHRIWIELDGRAWVDTRIEVASHTIPIEQMET